MIDLNEVNILTAKQILSRDMLNALNDIVDDSDRLLKIYEVAERAKACGCATKFDALIKTEEAQQKRLEKEKNKQLKVVDEVLPEAPCNETSFTVQEGGAENDITFRTGRWFVGPGGIKTYNGAMTVLASLYPIAITQCFADRETKNEEVELAWNKDGYHSIKAKRSIISSNTKIVGLADRGFPVTSETSKALVSYLSEFEKLNAGIIKKRISTSKFGWAGKDFMPYSENDVVFNVPQNYQALTSAVESRGDYQKWLDLVKKIRASTRPEPLIYMNASFGSILVSIINVSPFIVNLYGASGRGKTVNLMLASSVWGDPSKFLAESTSTLNSLEQRLNILNNLPMMIDDLSKIRDKGDGEKFSDLIYTLCSGQGKGRLNKNIEMRETATWANAILTNIERPLTTETMQGGAINRVLDFEIKEGDIFESGSAVVNIIKKNYGFAGKKFVEIVTEHYDEIDSMVKGYEDEIKKKAEDSKHEKEQKQVTPMAILLTAGELAEKYIFQDGIRLDLDYCVNSLKNVESVSEMERALLHIRDEVGENKSCYVPEDGKYKGKVYGFIDDGYTYIRGTVLEEISKKWNFNKMQFLRWAKSRNYLAIADNNRLTVKKTVPATGERTLFYALNLSVDGEDDRLEKDGNYT